MALDSDIAAMGIYMAIGLVIIIIIIVSVVVSKHKEKKALEEQSKQTAELAVPPPQPLPPQPQPTPPKSSFENNSDNDVVAQEPEAFNNDLPNQNIMLKEDEDNYAQTIQEMALDKSVLDQHNTYVNERNKVTSTASFQPSRSDAQDVVPFRGLRRPQYSSPEGKDLVDETARNVPSELDSDHLAKPTQIYWK